jgi:hypothetical protein
MTMAERLIDEKTLREKLYEWCGNHCNNSDGCQYCKVSEIIDIVEEMPTIETKPIVHAHWEEHREFYEDEGFEGYYYSCSNCGGTLYGDLEDFNFCHCCGAQMDEKESD